MEMRGGGEFFEVAMNQPVNQPWLEICYQINLDFIKLNKIHIKQHRCDIHCALKYIFFIMACLDHAFHNKINKTKVCSAIQ
jgi:hypothetical protein